MKSITWAGLKGNTFELRAECTITMTDDILDADGFKHVVGKKPVTIAKLELFVDGVKKGHCSDVNSWKIIDCINYPGYKMVKGLSVAMSPTQAEMVDAFLKSVIEEGKTAEVKEYEAAIAEAEKVKDIEYAKDILARAEKTTRNKDGSLMTKDQAKAWRKRYNDLYNEGGEGYVPDVITIEQVEYAKSILKKYGL